MTKHVVDYKQLEMSDEEFDYYKLLVKSFSSGTYSGTEQFRDLFESDEEGCITSIHPSIGKETAWAVLFFVQNLMINQRLCRIERKFSNV